MTERSNDHNIPGGRKTRPVITFDYSLYDHYLEDTELSDDQKREFLEALWSIICEFVALGFEVHPVQQANNEACGKLLESRTNLPISTMNNVKSGSKKRQRSFNLAACKENKNEH